MQDRFPAILRTAVQFVCVLILLLSPSISRASCTAPANAIEAENCLTGSPSSTWDIAGGGDPSIQGFAGDISYNVGGTVVFKINTNATNYRLDIYRMGYYHGSGARLIASVSPSATLPQSQPACLTDAATALVDCGNWAPSASWTIPANAVSGIYFAKVIRLDTGGASHIVFVVRNDASTSNILFQTSDATWQAYNPYGGHSLYGGPGTFDLTNRAYKVSYNRPFTSRGLEVESWMFYAEYPMVRWLEANGYDVTYFTSIDAARSGNLIANHRVYLSVGHDEYWSAQQRASVEAARNAGVNLAFFSGNEVFWKTRWENSIDGTGTPYRTLVCYKETLGSTSNPIATPAIDPLDPPIWTGTWRDPSKSPPADGGRPENALSGQMFRVNGPGTDNANLSIQIPAAQGKMRFWRNTAVAAQSAGQTYTLPPATLGYEWDVEPDNGFRPAGLFDLSTATYKLTTDYLLDYGGDYGAGTATHHMSMYRAASGALVFGAGTVQWSWGLDATHDGSGSAADVNMQQATVNVLADMGAQPATIQGGLLPAFASSDAAPPSSAITFPTATTNVQSGTVVTVQGTAADSGGGLVAGVEVSLDGGTTWHPATGTESWSYTWVVTTGATTVNLRSRAVDDSGNLETPSAGVPVAVAGAVCPCNIWNPAITPGNIDVGPDSAVELGVKFTATADGNVRGIRFYKSSNNTGTHTGSLWSSSGALLATATFTNETGSGWQQVNFSTPVAITANTVYIASYHTNVGHYSDDFYYFAPSGYLNPPLQALRDGASGGNGVFAYGSSSVFPNQAYRSSNYWVDVVFVSSATLTSIVVSPANPSVVAGNTQQFTATGTYSDGSTQNITGQVTWSSLNTAVATINSSGLASAIAGGSTTITAAQGSVSSAATLTVQPTGLVIKTTSLPNGQQGQPYSAALSATGGTAPYTWSVANGSVLPAGLALSSAGVISGTAVTPGTGTFSVQLADDGSPPQTAVQQLSITILAAPTYFTIWSPAVVPGIVDAGPDSAVELGVKFKADANGTITGVRFYKSSNNTGTHVGNLWTASGALLASATFTGETASGWQQVTFSSPVAITANTVYVASYHTNVGHYSVDQNYFANAGVDNPPLHALQNNASGFDGVFVYSSSSVFPSQGYLASNYWVDVVFAPAASLSSIAVTPANPSIASGTTQQFTATGTYSDGSTQDVTAQVTWSSSNAAVATVSSSGLASSTVAGTTTISATQGSVTGSTTLTVQATPLAITTTVLPGGVQSQPYSATLAASGGTPPYRWSLANNTSLPPGLTLSSAGQITGTPTVLGTTSFTVQAMDSGSPAQSATQALSITIVPPPCPCTLSGTISGSGGNGATVTLSGTSAATATANASGGYTFTGLASGSYTVTPSRAGFVFTPASQAVTINNASVSGVNFSSTAQLAIDQTASTDRSGNGTNIVSPAVTTTKTNELLLALVSTSATTTNMTVTSVTGAGLTWTLVKRTNTQMGTAEIWRAWAPNKLNKVKVTANLSQSTGASITVVTFTGADASGTGGSGAIGATGSGNANPGAPTASLTTTRNNSWVFGVGTDWDKATARTLGANQTLVHQFLATSKTFWIQSQSATTPASGTLVTINDTAPTTDRYNMTICEILPAQ